MTVWQKISGTVATIGASGSAVLQHMSGLGGNNRDSAAPDLGTSFTIAMIALAAKMAAAKMH